MARPRKLPQGVTKLANGRYRLRFRVDGKARSKTFDDLDTCLAEQARIAADKYAGTVLDPKRGRVTVADYASEWLASKRVRSTTKERMESIVRTHIVPKFGDRQLVRLRHEDVVGWVKELEDAGKRPGTVSKTFKVMNAMMKSAVVARRIPFNPCEGVELLPDDLREQRFLDKDQVKELAAAMKMLEPRFYALILVAAYGGLRWGELAALRRRDVDVMRGRLFVRQTLVEIGKDLTIETPKTKRSIRNVRLPRRVINELAQHLNEYVDPDPDALVFKGPRGGLLRRAGFRRCWWLPAVRAANLDGLRVHDLRHTFVSLWIAAGRDLGEVSRAAGHSSHSFTDDRYRHLYEDEDDGLPDRLDSLLA